MFEGSGLQKYFEETDDDKSLNEYTIDECLSDGGYGTTRHTAHKKNRSKSRGSDLKSLDDNFLSDYKFESRSLGGDDYSDTSQTQSQSAQSEYPTKQFQKYQVDIETRVKN